MKVRIPDCARPITKPVDLHLASDVDELQAHVNRCVLAMRNAFQSPCVIFDPVQREHVGQIYHAMKCTDGAIKELLRSKTQNPLCVDALPLARIQLERMFCVCLTIEDPSTITLYLKNDWKFLYVRDLLQRAECADIQELMAVLDAQAGSLEQLRQLAGVTDEEKEITRCEALGLPTPKGFSARPIRPFPTPAAVLDRIKDTGRKQMLSRLYLEYSFLCVHVHFSPRSVSFRGLLDSRESFAGLLSTEQLELMFQKEIAQPSIWISFLSIVQSCTELISHFPADVELRRTVAQAWAPLASRTSIGQSIWETRSKRLVGVLTP